MIQKARIIIKVNNIFTISFISNLKDGKSREDKRNGNSAETLKTNINLRIKNKEKGKYRKQKLR